MLIGNQVWGIGYCLAYFAQRQVLRIAYPLLPTTRLLTLLKFYRFLVLLYVSFYFSLKAHLKPVFRHHNYSCIVYEQNPEKSTESTAYPTPYFLLPYL
jgi:hypothetical protein